MKIKNCTKCPNLVKSRIQIVNGYGNKNADIMFIGICPGNHNLLGGADKTGIPFKGDKSGKLFERLLSTLKLSRNDVYTTNLVKCRPAKLHEIYRNRLPSSDEIDNCFPYLMQEIKDVKPKIIFAMGKVVYAELKKYEQLLPPFVYIFHPGFLIRNGENTELFDKWITNIKYNIEQWATVKPIQRYIDDF